jgi:hypothetical protein
VVDLDIPRWAGAIDDPVGEDGRDVGFPPRPERDRHPIAPLIERKDPPREDGQLAIAPGLVDHPGDLRGDPYAAS